MLVRGRVTDAATGLSLDEVTSVEIGGDLEDGASIAIWRLTAVGWRSIDGIGNDEATGLWSFRVPHLGRYRIAAYVDHHCASPARWW